MLNLLDPWEDGVPAPPLNAAASSSASAAYPHTHAYGEAKTPMPPNLLDTAMYPLIAEGIITASAWPQVLVLREVSSDLRYAVDRAAHRYISVWGGPHGLEAETLSGTWERSHILPRLNLATYAASVRVLDLPNPLPGVHLDWRRVRPSMLRIGEDSLPPPNPAPTTIVISHKIPVNVRAWLDVRNPIAIPPVGEGVKKLVVAILYVEPDIVAASSLLPLTLPDSVTDVVLHINKDAFPQDQVPKPVALVHNRATHQQGCEYCWVVPSGQPPPSPNNLIEVERLDLEGQGLVRPDQPRFLDSLPGIVAANIRLGRTFTFVGADEWPQSWLRGSHLRSLESRLDDEIARAVEGQMTSVRNSCTRFISAQEYRREVGHVEFTLSSQW